MSDTLVESFEHAGLEVQIHWEYDPMNPREWDNLAEMVAFPRLWREYEIADRESTGTEDDAFERGAAVLERWYRMQGAEILFFTFQDYGSSGARLFEDNSPDETSAGFFLVTRDRMIAEWGDDSEETRAIVRRNLAGECKTMGMYVEGDVYGYVIDSTDDVPDSGDSCWGFFGIEDVREQAKEAAEFEAKMIAEYRDNERRERERAANQDIATIGG